MSNRQNRGGNKHRKQPTPKPYIKPTVLPDESLNYFQWELRPHKSMAEEFLKKYPMSDARNNKIDISRRTAIDVILANMHNGMRLNVPNFEKIRAEEVGFGREVFLAVLDYLKAPALIGRLGGEGYKRSTITYSSNMRTFFPPKVVFQHKSPVRINLKKEEEELMGTVNKEVKNELNKRMRTVWAFYREHEILPGIDAETFQLFSDYEVEVEQKPELIKPDPARILPQFIFNDRNLAKGGRMYGTFWIEMKSELRRLITIDGELTSDIDGKGMHVQLLYRDKGKPMPPGDPYIFTDPVQRKTAKDLMLFMMNTRNKHDDPVAGRKAVQRTYQRKFGKTEGLEDIILKLEGHHHQIFDYMYKPNWHHLQRTEAAIMLSIMEKGMTDDVVVLPIHDGCLCPRTHVERVQGYFDQEGIVAEVNLKHYQPLPIEKTREALSAVRMKRQAA